MSVPAPARHRLAAAREVWAWREAVGAPRVGSAAYAAYGAVLTVLVIVVPLARVVAAALSRGDVLPLLLAPRAPGLEAAAWMAACAALVVAGTIRGPAVLAPFFAATLASADLPRRLALARPYGVAAALMALAGAALGALLAAPMVWSGAITVGAAAMTAVGGVGAGLLACGTWLLGEIAPPAIVRVIAASLLALAAVLASGAVRIAGPLPVVTPAAALGVLAAGIAVVAIGHRALDRVRGAVLIEQGVRWEAAGTVASSGDVAGAAGFLRALPTVGRRLPAVRVTTAPPRVRLGLLYLRRDLVALGRTPERTIGGLLAIFLGDAALCGLGSVPPLVGGVLVVGGAAAAWSGSGVLIDGIRHAVATIGAPPLLAQDVSAQLRLHAVAPSLVLGACTLLAALIVPSPLPLLLAPLLVLARVRDAAKGPMPLALMTPVPTAMGDMAALRMLAWQADAPLLAVACGGVLALVLPLGPLTVVVVELIAASVLLRGAVGRLRELRA